MPVYQAGIRPDLTFPVATFTHDESVEPDGGAQTVTPTDTFSIPPDAAAIRNIQLSANAAFSSPETTVVGAVGASWDAQAGDSFATVVSGGVRRTPHVVSPFSISPSDLSAGTVQSSGGIYWHPEFMDPEDIPDNQIGFEWLDEPGVPGGVRVIPPTDVLVTLDIAGRNWDDSVETPITGWLTDFVAQHPSADLVVTSDTLPMVGFEEIKEWTTPDGVIFMQSEGLQAGDVETVEVSLIDYLDDRSRAVIWARGLKPDDVPLVQADLGGSNNSDNGIDYGNTFGVTAQVWHYRPPAYRWILDAAPALRLYPRDGDGRGLGGVTRHYPPPRSTRSFPGHR